MAWTEFGTGKRPIIFSPASAKRACTRSPTAHTCGLPGKAASVLIAHSATTSLNWPTNPWSDPNTMAPTGPTSG